MCRGRGARPPVPTPGPLLPCERQAGVPGTGAGQGRGAPARHAPPCGSTFQAHPRTPPALLPLSFLKESPTTGGGDILGGPQKSSVWGLAAPRPTASPGWPAVGRAQYPPPPALPVCSFPSAPPPRASGKWPGPRMGLSAGEQREEEARPRTPPPPPCPSPGLWLGVSGSWAPPRRGSQGWFRGQGLQRAQPTGRPGRGQGEGPQRGKHWRH